MVLFVRVENIHAILEQLLDGWLRMEVKYKIVTLRYFCIKEGSKTSTSCFFAICIVQENRVQV